MGELAMLVFVIAVISGISAISLVSTSPVTATANPIHQPNTTGNYHHLYSFQITTVAMPPLPIGVNSTRKKIDCLNSVFILSGATGTNAEFARTPTAWTEKVAKVAFMGSTEPGSVSYNALESTMSNSVSMPEFPSDESALTVIEIENPFSEHVYIGSKGPNQRESDAITRALDWLSEKRSPDYGWGNSTHMVILAKEVCYLVATTIDNRLILFHLSSYRANVILLNPPTRIFKLFKVWKTSYR